VRIQFSQQLMAQSSSRVCTMAVFQKL